MNEMPPNDPKQDALNFIEMTKQECYQMGFNDSEFDRLNQIRDALEAGDIDPEEAKQRAAQVKESKADYH